MQAIILAAGMGNRLGTITSEMPKCLVPVNGTPMLINALDRLQERDVTEVIMVVGYMKEAVYEAIGHRYGDMNVTYVENNDYDKTNNVYSLWLAQNYLNKDTILLECDVFFDGMVIDKVLDDRKDCKVLVSRCEPFMSGTVVEIGPDGVIEKLITSSDQHPGFDFSDKFKTVNIYFFSKEFMQQYFLPNLELYIKTQGTSSYYELVLGALIYLRNPKVHATVVDGLQWSEIDDESDLRRAEYMFASRDQKAAIISPLHGGFWRYDFVDFCYLFNLYFPNEGLINDLQSGCAQVMRNYPSGMGTICSLMGRAMKLPPQSLVVGNGAAELIRLLNKFHVEKTTIPIPTFNEYESGLNREQINYYDTRPNDFNIDPDAFIESALRSGSNAALIINPNNPTSLLRPRDTVLRILDGLRDLDMIMVDESFLDFSSKDRSGTSVEDAIGDYKNLVLIRSISKEFGVPGLRLGYVASSNDNLVSTLRQQCPVWNINGMAEIFLELLPKYLSDYRSSCKLVSRDATALYQRLKEFPFLDMYEPEANFVFGRVTNGRTAAELKDWLFLHHNLLIKDCTNKTGLESGEFVRISARTPIDNRKLLVALKEFSPN